MAKIGIQNTVTVEALRRAVSTFSTDKSLEMNTQKMFRDLSDAFCRHPQFKALVGKANGKTKVVVKVVIEEVS